MTDISDTQQQVLATVFCDVCGTPKQVPMDENSRRIHEHLLACGLPGTKFWCSIPCFAVFCASDEHDA